MSHSLTFGELITQLIIFVFLSFLAYHLGKRWKIWSKKSSPVDIQSIWIPIMGVVILFGSAFIVGFLARHFALFGEVTSSLLLSPTVFALYQSSALVLNLIIVFVFLRFKKVSLWGPGSFSRITKEFFFGMLFLIFSFPFVTCMNIAVKLAMALFGVVIEPRQEVLNMLERSFAEPSALFLMLLVITVIVPLAEEVLFRGLIQNYLRQRLGKKLGLSLSITVFTLAHFSISQSLGNLEILLTLLVISIFLTILYEVRGTLWATFGLHFSFNALTSIVMLVQHGG